MAAVVPDPCDTGDVRGRRTARGRPQPSWWLAVLLASLPGLVAHGYFVSRGMAISPDSVNYLAGARSLLAGDGYLAMDGRHNGLHPPGLSVLLAISHVVSQLPPEQCAAVLNGVALLVITVATAWLVWSGAPGRSPLPSACAALLVGLCPVVLLPASAVWTETPFLALTLAAWAMVLSPPLRRGRRTTPPSAARGWIVGGLLGVAALFRYAGVISVVATVGVLAWRRQWRDLPRVAVPGLGPVAGWVWFNSRYGEAVGERPSSAADPEQVLGRAGTVVAQWFTPAWSGWPMVVASVLVVLAWVVVVVLGFRSLTGVYGTALVLAAVTTVTVLGVRMVTALDGPDNRLLITAAPLLMVVAVGVVSEAVAGPRRALAIAAAVVLAVGALGGWATMHRGAAPPRHDPVVARACEAPEGAVLVSNRQAQMAHTCQRPVLAMPRAHPYASDDPVDDLPMLRERTAGRCTWYVWVGPERQGHYRPWPDVVRALDLSPHRFGAGQRAVTGC